MSNINTDFLLDHAQSIARESAKSKGSLADFAKKTRIETSVMLDTRAVMLPYLDSVLHSALNIFTGYYLQAIYVMSMEVRNAKTVDILDSVNPDKDVRGDVVSKMDARVFESFSSEGLLAFPNQNSLEDIYGPSLEADDKKSGSVGKPSSIDFGSENANLSVGKLINVELATSEKESVNIPVSVRLRTSAIRPEALSHTLAIGSNKDEHNLKERWHGWRSGRLKMIRDVLLAQDLVEKHRENLAKDETGYYRLKQKQDRKNIASMLLNPKAQVGPGSSIFVFTSETAKEFERKARVDLSKFKDREKIFHETYSMIFFVIDTEWESITIYHRGLEEPNEVSVKEIQRLERRGKGGPDVLEILNAFRESKTPTI